MVAALRLALASLPFIALAACTTTTIIAPPPPASSPDAGDQVMDPPVTADEDAGPPADDAMTAPDINTPVDPSYPARHTPIPLVDFGGGAVLQAPKVVTITFAGDPQRAQLEQFGDIITTTPWWDAVTEGYCSPPGSSTCIGHGSGGGHVVVPTTPGTSLTDSAQGGASSIKTFIKAKVAAGTFPAPTANTIYAIYFPAGVSITLDGASSCQEFGAYHDSLSLPSAGGNIEVAYAIMPRCDSSLQNSTVSASHELIEAATDPHVGSGAISYYMQDELWGSLGGEVGDICVDFTGAGADVVQESGFSVQRSWSNIAAKASHDPCVPAPNVPYFNVAPVANSVKTAIAVGQSATIELDAFSDGAMADWTVDAISFQELQGGGASPLSFTLDTQKARNGSKIQLTVQLASKPSNGYAEYAIISRSGKTTHFWPALITAK